MSTMAIKSAVTMDHVKSGKKADFVSRFKKYMEDNVAISRRFCNDDRKWLCSRSDYKERKTTIVICLKI